MQIVIQAKKAVILTNHQADLVSDVIVTVQNGRIESIEAASTFSQSQVDQMVTEADEALVTPLLLPGFVDIHSHGLGGHEDVACNWMNPGACYNYFLSHHRLPMSYGCDVEHTLSRLPSRGTTSTLASLIPSDQDSLQRY
jgi:N-acetylglucosamine-6-phosphate deacetylase